MNPENLIQVQKFIKNAEKFSKTWNFIEFKVGAHRINHNEYIIFAMEIRSLENGTPQTEILFDSFDIIIFETTWAINFNQFREILLNLEKGSIFIGNNLYKLTGVSDIKTGWGRFRGGYHHFSHSKGRTDKKFPYLTLNIRGTKPLKDIINQSELNRSLNTLGYEDFNRLCEEYLQINFNYNEIPKIMITSPIYIQTDVNYNEGELSVEVNLHKNLETVQSDVNILLFS